MLQRPFWNEQHSPRLARSVLWPGRGNLTRLGRLRGPAFEVEWPSSPGPFRRRHLSGWILDVALKSLSFLPETLKGARD